jgi:AcrR family transcriptional regulator
MLDAAARILDEEGVGALSVRRLAAEADVSGRAVYSLFGDMRGLLAALYRSGFETMVRRHEQVPINRDPRVEIEQLALAYRRAALERKELYGLMFERAAAGFRPDRDDVAFAMRSLERVEQAVGRALGGRPRDVETVTLQLWALVHGLASLELRGALGPPRTARERWLGAIRSFTTGALGGPAGTTGT